MVAFGEAAEVVVADGDDVAGHSNTVSGSAEVVLGVVEHNTVLNDVLTWLWRVAA